MKRLGSSAGAIPARQLVAPAGSYRSGGGAFGECYPRELAAQVKAFVEQVREASRLAEVRSRGEDFMQRMEVAERQAIRLRDALQDYGKNPSVELRKEVEAVFAAENKNCSCCHTQHRDTRSR